MATNARPDHRRRQRNVAFADNRSQLLSTPRQKRKSSTANEAAGIQQSLSRTHRLLEMELSRVSHVAQAIETDERLLKETMHDHQTMNVKSAKKALTALEREQQKEQRVLAASVVFFWLVVVYVLWGRVLTRLPFFDRTMALLFQIVPALRQYFS